MFEADGIGSGPGTPSVAARRLRTADVRARPRIVRTGRDPVVALATGMCGLWIIGFAVATYAVRADRQGMRILGDGVYFLPVVLATVLSAVAAWRTRDRQRVFWTLIAVSNLLWTAGEAIWDYHGLVLGHDMPFPSVADAFYLASYAAVPAAIIAAYGRAGIVWRALLDSSILGLAVGVAGYLLLVRPQLSQGFTVATLVGVGYPILGVVILMLLLSLAFGAHMRLPRALVVVGAAFAISALTDAAYTYFAVVHSYLDGSWLNVGWQAEAVALCLAAVIAIRHREPEALRRPHASDSGLVPVLAGCALTLAIFVLDSSLGRIRPLVGLLALYSVTALVLRLWLLSREKDRVARELEGALSEQQRLAVSDGLTGLHNRRFFEEVMRLEADRSMRAQRNLGLLVLDLDHFKQINDRYGHPAGDAVLRETARRLTEVARRSDVVARYGGEEFVLVLPELGAIEVVEVAERVRRAVGEHPMLLPNGTPISVTTSVGAACLPDHGHTPTELMQAADQALYTAKQHGRNQVQFAGERMLPIGSGPAQEESAFAYLQALVDEIEALDGRPEHSRAVARWTGLVADALGLRPEERWRTVAAARFLDLGHVTIPDSIVTKPGRLTARQRALIHRHPAEGARLLRLAPGMADVAAIVADHHERLDGTGYPQGKVGGEIGIEARIVAACDAWAAMLADRAHRKALTPAQARTELERAAGGGLDSDVVDALIALHCDGLIGAATVAAAV